MQMKHTHLQCSGVNPESYTSFESSPSLPLPPSFFGGPILNVLKLGKDVIKRRKTGGEEKDENIL